MTTDLLSDDELATLTVAALTVVLLTRAGMTAGRPGDPPAAPAVPPWERRERHAFHRAPISRQH